MRNSLLGPIFPDPGVNELACDLLLACTAPNHGLSLVPGRFYPQARSILMCMRLFGPWFVRGETPNPVLAGAFCQNIYYVLVFGNRFVFVFRVRWFCFGFTDLFSGFLGVSHLILLPNTQSGFFIFLFWSSNATRNHGA